MINVNICPLIAAIKHLSRVNHWDIMALSSLKVPFLCRFVFSLRYPKTIPDTCCLTVRKVKSKHVVTDSPEGVFSAFFHVLFAAQLTRLAVPGWECSVGRGIFQVLEMFQISSSFMGIAPPLTPSHSPGRRTLIMGLVSQVNKHSWWKPCSHTAASDVY